MCKDYSAEDLENKIAYLRNAGSIVRRLGGIQVADGFDALATEIEELKHEGDRSPSRSGLIGLDAGRRIVGLLQRWPAVR
jgi:hypothetical protein